MMRKLLLTALVGLMGLIGCSSPTPEELASQAAKGYYEHLVAGEYDEYLQGVAGYDSMPGDYREQLLMATKMTMARQKREHQGINEVQVSSAKADSAARYTNVFLVLCYADSVREEICVPMVDVGGRWQMK